MEKWKKIKGYEGLYEVSNTGLVRSLFRYKKVMKGQLFRDGYLKIRLYKDSTKKRFMMHHLVAMAFKRNPKNYPLVNHKDGNKENNNHTNLEWLDYSGNLAHAYKTGLRIVSQAQIDRLVHYNKNKNKDANNLS